MKENITAPHNTSIAKQKELIAKQKEFFNSGETKSYSFRKQQLQKLNQIVSTNELAILEALKKDLGKPHFEGYTSEVGFIYEEIKTTLKHLSSWMKPKSVGTPLAHFPSKSSIHSEPKGVTLIIGPWNYPFQLLLAPAVAAISAGNTCILKPSEETPHTAVLVEEIISQNFDESFLALVQGEGRIVVPEMIENNRFDHIFFTGSVPVGRIVAQLAAPHLTPVTLELGGKSPGIIDKTANLEVAARRIVFGKWLNAGQTCVAPDYLLIHKTIKAKFLDELKAAIIQSYGVSPLEEDDLAFIINQKRYETLKGYLKEGDLLYGGGYNDETRKIEPTLISGLTFDDKLLQDEIFGPILPILTYETVEEVKEIVSKNPYPLSFYVFTKDKHVEKELIHGIQFGGGAINNAIVHLANPELPFGGIGTSGFGNYHGKAGFDAFSHQKSILKSGTWFDLKQKYPPYSKLSMKLARFFMRK